MTVLVTSRESSPPQAMVSVAANAATTEKKKSILKNTVMKASDTAHRPKDAIAGEVPKNKVGIKLK